MNIDNRNSENNSKNRNKNNTKMIRPIPRMARRSKYMIGMDQMILTIRTFTHISEACS
jgi:hypothetical protein